MVRYSISCDKKLTLFIFELFHFLIVNLPELFLIVIYLYFGAFRNPVVKPVKDYILVDLQGCVAMILSVFLQVFLFVYLGNVLHLQLYYFAGFVFHALFKVRPL